MTIEIKLLIGSIFLGIFHLLLATQLATKVHGIKWNLSPRDEKMPELRGLAGRVERAWKNFMQTFPFFLAAILITEILNIHNEVNMIGACIYLAARVIYVPIYAAGIVGLRTLVWLTSMAGLVMVLLAPFF